MIRALKQCLVDTYGGFADKRIKRLDSGTTFIVDDRGRGDRDAQNALFLWFCTILVDVRSATEVRVSVGGSVPTSPQILEWAQRQDAQVEHGGRFSFSISPPNLSALGELADLVQAVVAPGAPRYAENSYKYTCPRTAKSLRRLRDVLMSHWRPGQ
jgi:hypothetical protein